MAETIPTIAPIPATIPPIVTAQTASEQTKPDAAQKTDADKSGAATQTAQTEAQPNITETPEFKAALTAAIEKKIPQLKRQIAKSISGEKDDSVPDANDLQLQLSETQNRLRSFEAKAAVRDFLSDPKHKLNVPSDSISGIEELVINRLEYGDDGKPSNLKDAIESVKTSFPRLFAAQPSSINAGEGRFSRPQITDMNQFIRAEHARR